ncbi:D-ribose ABC transporter substrate-binding protein [Candidatus Epulonipiscium fishelsonii]|uniref:D-ribose ABC transporter substrate-binding protein n=1 Tax=Candidatus Epulonipiscium fishelsonii TaxID=77094 RepID=A0ACC8XBA2_9FIRM|nr:D-ribose ABC transporter substrate-binding protein [Epulopiscium sp. SCG-B11WGA-EpuloA1]ONI43446.1 D-ribose ABC transporter substrate-binding protein [Epulopiscium sp. SCG-B05WGA-EpuloA1]
MRKLFRVFLTTLALSACMTGCSSGVEEPATTSEVETSVDDEIKVGFAVSTLNNPFFVSLVEGAELKAEELGVELVVVDAGDDVAKQVSNIEDLMSKNIDVLVVNPVDSSAVSPIVGDVINKGIKTISVDRGVDGQTVDVAIASDNVQGAELATQYLLDKLGANAKVAELVGIEGSSAAINRGQGFHNIADANFDVVSSQTANFNRAEGLTVTENILQANSDLQGIFAHNDEMALGAIEATSGKDILVVGFDATDDALAAVAEGRMGATVQQQPSLMGAVSIETAVRLVNGETVDPVIGVEVELVTAE